MLQFGLRSVMSSVGVTSLALVAGCVDVQDPQSPETRRQVTVATRSVQSIRTIDDRFAEVADEVPGFAGAYVDPAGQLNILMVDPARLGDATDALAREFTDIPELAATQRRVRTAVYDFRQLQDWRLEVRTLLGMPGVVALRIDEAANKVTVGVATQVAQSKVEAALANIGVPPEAVAFELTGPNTPTEKLTDKVRPVVGGLQHSTDDGGPDECTTGFPALWGAERVVVVAGHCTSGTIPSGMGSVVGDFVYYQPTKDAGISGPIGPSAPTPPVGNRIGTEVHDKAWFFCALYDVICRYSDAALARFDGGVASDLGKLARTTGVNNGSTTISSTQPRFTVVGESTLSVGQTAHRLGRVTGWSSGPVRDTCEDIVYD